MDLLETCDDIVGEYLQDGYTLTTRQLYYQLVARDLIENSVKSYNRIKGLISEARLAGLLDWDAIEDRGRVVHQATTWKTPQEIIRAAARGYRIDHWKYQPLHVLVMVEKQALEGVLEGVCSKWGVDFVANKGYASSTLLYQQGRSMKWALEDHKTVVVLYLGDHDPSGLDMDRDILERLEMFAEFQCADLHLDHTRNDELLVERLALTMPQIGQYNPPPNPAKMTDARAASYIKAYGKSSWELDALAPSILEKLVDDKIKQLIDSRGIRFNWTMSHDIEAKMKDDLQEFCGEGREEHWEELAEPLRKDLEAELEDRRVKRIYPRKL
jgi:hypothetical protein